MDPLTQTPFPTPLPRSALPAFADPTLKRAVEAWKAQAVGEIYRVQIQRQVAQSQATTNAILSSVMRPSYTNYLGAAGMGMGAGAVGQNFLSQYTQPAAAATTAATGGDHSTALDAATAAINLTSTIAGAMTGTGGLGGGILGGMLFPSS